MNTIKFDKKQALMVAHRGASGLEPENSVPAFIAAGNRSYFGVETDIHVTADGKIVAIHDESTKRVAEKELNVEEAAYEQVRDIILKDMSKLEMQNDVQKNTQKRPYLMIPSLEEYICICKKYEKVCVLELKNRFVPSDIEKVIAEIDKLEYLENVIFISFDFDNMKD